MLARSFWQDLGGDPRELLPETLARWAAYAWPGNVRELRNAVARRLALGDLADLDAKGGRRTPEPTVTSTPSRSVDAVDAVERVLDQPFIRARDTLMEEFEQRYVERLLAAHGGDVARAAAASGIGRRYFQKIKARSAK